MLYLDYSRPADQWVPNRYGGRENLEAIEFLKQLNILVHAEYPDAITVAEESTSWPIVSRQIYVGGLGFDLNWNLGWRRGGRGGGAGGPGGRRGRRGGGAGAGGDA